MTLCPYWQFKFVCQHETNMLDHTYIGCITIGIANCLHQHWPQPNWTQVSKLKCHSLILLLEFPINRASHLASKTHSFSLNESTNEIFQHSNTTLVPLGAHHDVSQQHLPSTLKPTNIITRHACFSNLNLDQCHQSASQFESECMWCDYWCIFKEPMIGNYNCQ